MASLITPIMFNQSGKALAESVSVSKTSQVYFYKKFSASYVYYSGHIASLLHDSDKAATNIWTLGKEVMPLATPSTVEAELDAMSSTTKEEWQQPRIYIFVEADDVAEFEQTSMYKKLHAYAIVGHTHVYVR